MHDMYGGEPFPEDAAVLPFERRAAGDGLDRALNGTLGGWRHTEHEDYLDDDFGSSAGYDFGYGAGYGRDLGQLTMLVLIGDTVVDTIRRPVAGSEYACAALELGRGAPPPPPRIVEKPMQPRHELERTWLRSLVGGQEELEILTKDPLPDEPLDAELVPPDLRDRVTVIAGRVDPVAQSLIGVEGRTACRRLLARAVAAEPALLLANDRDDIAAGAVIHAIAKANNVIGPGCALTSTALWTYMGLKSSPHDRARRFAHAVAGPDGVEAGYGYGRREPDVWRLGSADLLVGRFRGFLMVLRAIADLEGEGSASG